ncbi:MAG: ABC transporter ATP-binding protein [Eggerthella lenta]
MILLESVSKTYEMGEGVVRALDHVDLQVDQGDFLAIVGPSGSGKSTLMNILGLLDVPDEGRYLLDGMDVGALSDNRLASIRNEKIGFVFQSTAANSTALENEAAQRTALRLKEADSVPASSSRYWVSKGERHLPNQLSGGRVAIARALCASRRSSCRRAHRRSIPGGDVSCSSLHAGPTVILITLQPGLATRRSVSCVLLTA